MRYFRFFILFLIVSGALSPAIVRGQCDPDGVWLERQAYTSSNSLLIGQTGCVKGAVVISPLQTSNDTIRLIGGGTVGYVLTWNGTIWVPAATDRQTISAGDGAGTDKTINLSDGGGAVVLREGSGVDLTRTGDTITITSTSSGADDWGAQVVQRDSSLQGNGTTGSPLGIKGYGAASNDQVPSKTTGGITWITPITAEIDGDTLNEAWTIDADDADLEVISTQIVKFEGGGIITTDYVPGTNTLVISGIEADGSTSNEGVLGVSAGGSNDADLTSSTSLANPVNFAGGGIVNITETTSTNGGVINITATEVDGSTTNELQTIANTSDATSHTATLSNSGGSVQIIEGTGIGLATGGTGLNGTVTVTNTAPDQTVSITGAGINVVTGTYPNFTVTGTEIDGSVTNEGSLTVGAGGANTSTIVSNTSGSTAVTLSGSNTILVTESGSTVTIQADTSLLATVNDLNNLPGRVDSSFVKISGSYLNKRITDNLYRNGTTGFRTTDTSGIVNIYGQAHPKPGIYARYANASTNGFLFFQLDPDGQTNNSSVGNFNFWGTNFDGANSPYSTRANHVWRMGYNTGQAGTRVLSTDADLHIAFESMFYNVYTTGRRKRSWEWHLQSQDTLDGVHRMISAIGSHDGKDGELTFGTNRLAVIPYTGSSSTWMDFDYITKNAYIDTMRLYFNEPQVGYPFLSFRNAGNTAYLKMFQADASNRLVINADGNDLYTYAPNFVFNTLATITTNDGNPIQIGNSTLKSFASIYAPGTEVLRLRSNTGGANTWSTYVNSDNIEYRTSSGGAYMYFYAGSAYILGANDRIGIGTSPGARFHVRQNGNAGGNGFQMTNSDASFSVYQAVNASGDYIWYHNGGSQRAILTQGGSLGLMTSGTPARTLQVTGEARITDLTTDTPTQIVGADADGDLGAITVGSGLNLSGGTLTATAGGLTGSGAANQVAYWTSSTNISGSNNLTWDGTTHTVTGKGVYAVGGSFGASSIGVDMSGNMTSTANSVNMYGFRNSITFANDGTKTGNTFRGIYMPTTTSSSTAGSHAALVVEPTNSSPNVTSLYGVQGIITESSTSGNLGNRYGGFFSLDKSANDNTTHTAYGSYARIRDNSTSGRWGTGYGMYSELTNAQNGYGIYITTSNTRGTANNAYGMRVSSTVSGTGITATDVVGVELAHSEASSGAITNYYGIRSTSTPAADNNYALYFSQAGWLAHINGSLGIGAGTTTPARTLHIVGEARISDLATDTPTKIVGADADGDLDTVGIGAEAELHITNGTIGTNFHTTISPAALTTVTNNWNPTGLSTAWIIRLSGNGSFVMLTGITAPAFNKRLIIYNSGTDAVLLPTESTSSTAGNRFSFGRDVILFGGKSIEIIYDVTLSRWQLLSKAGLYDDVENQYFNTSFNAPVSTTPGDYDFWNIVSEAAASITAPTSGRKSRVSVNTGTSTTGKGYVASKQAFFQTDNSSGTVTWAYCKAVIQTPATLSNGTDDYTIRVGFNTTLGGGGASDGIYFDYNHANVSGNWGCNTTNAGNTQRNNSGVAVATSTVYVLEVVVRPSLLVEYFINGTRVATNDTFVSTGDDMYVLSEIEKSVGTAQRDIEIFTLQTSVATVR